MARASPASEPGRVRVFSWCAASFCDGKSAGLGTERQWQWRWVSVDLKHTAACAACTTANAPLAFPTGQVGWGGALVFHLGRKSTVFVVLIALLMVPAPLTFGRGREAECELTMNPVPRATGRAACCR